MSEVLIIKTLVDRLSNEEHMAFCMEAGGLMRSADAEALHAEDLVPKHTARLATLDETLQKIVKSHRTEQIRAADKERDEAYRGLVRFNKAMLLHDTLTVREAAGRLKIAIDTYGNVLTMNYEKESAAVYNLIQDLKTEKYAADAAAVGLTPWVLKLEQRNNTFKNLLNLRDQEAAAGVRYIAVKDARRNIDKIYARFRNRVNSYVDEEAPDPALTAFVTQLNIVVKRFNTLAVRRINAGKKKGAKKGSGGDGASTPPDSRGDGEDGGDDEA